MSIYIDTSALVKRYVLERNSDAFDTFLSESDDDCVLTALGATEFESVLQRLKRQGYIDSAFEHHARTALRADMENGLWTVHPFRTGSFVHASDLMRTLGLPLATLDALHLASALDVDCDRFATGDRQLARAAAATGLVVHDFSHEGLIP